jgi:hypothetical protein
LKAKRDRGDYVGAIPIYGYTKSMENKNKLIIDENTAPVIQDIFYMKLQGMSAAKIAANLNSQGILSPLEYKRSKGVAIPKQGYADKLTPKWCATTILRILKDETYTGTLIQGRQSTPNYKHSTLVSLPKNKWIKTNNAHSPIISRSDFDTVQRSLTLDTRTNHNLENVYLFSGILICGSCGNNMTRKSVPYKDKKYIYYYCSTGKKNGCASPATVKENDLYDTVLNHVKAHIQKIIELESRMQEKHFIDFEPNEYIKQLSEHENESQKYALFKSSLYQNLINGILTNDEYVSYKNYYNEKILRLNADIDDLIGRIKNISLLSPQNMCWMQNFKLYANLTELDRTAVVRMIQNICIKSKGDYCIRFNYQDKYEQVVRFFISKTEDI